MQRLSVREGEVRQKRTQVQLKTRNCRNDEGRNSTRGRQTKAECVHNLGIIAAQVVSNSPGLLERIPDSVINSKPGGSLPSILHVKFPIPVVVFRIVTRQRSRATVGGA